MSKIFNLYFEKDIEKKDFLKEKFYKEELEVLKPFKNQIFNLKVSCKKCKKNLKYLILNDKLSCPYCYNILLKKVLEKKYSPSLIDSKILKFFLSIDKNYIYRGKRPEYTKKYFDDEIKINDLKRELLYCIKIEDFGKCEVLKYTIEDMEFKQIKIRRKING